MLTVGCLCRAVRYRVDAAPENPSNCHCSLCRRASGAPFVAWFTVPLAGFTIVSGKLQSYRSSPKAKRGFCAACGTQVTFAFDALPDRVDVTTCSLDDPNLVPPRDNIYTSTTPSWVKLADGLPSYRDARNKN